MKRIEQPDASLPAGVATAVALGYFDGVHIGHRDVLAAARECAQRRGLAPAVFTFALGAKPGVAGGRLLSEEQRLAAFAVLGMEYCFAPPFESFRSLSPTAFFETVLLEQYKAKALFCGENFAFGKNRSGDVALLHTLCRQNGVELKVVPMTNYAGAPVSSRRIRLALAEGDIQNVNAMLGRPYEIAFPVKSGRKLGRSLGFPTINQIFPAELQPPRPGVYITQTLVDGKAWPSATGYGNRPTVDGRGETCETFIPGFSGDLYGRAVHVRFFAYIAPIKRFETPQALAEAVRGYAAQALAYFED